jgi:Cof subfamily protein (haloacid dehalogenase superfamily)
MQIKALCTDIDGTLLDSRRQLSNRTISAIKSVASTMPVILASSRMPAAMRHLQAELGIHDHPLVCYNGGYVIHSIAGQLRVFESITIPVNVCRGIYELAAGTSINVSLYHADEWYAPRMDKWTEREEQITKVKSVIKNAEEVFATWERESKGAHKVMCMGPAEEIQKMELTLREQFGDIIHVYFSRPTYLELAPKEISKATGVALALQKVYDLSMSAVMAFGDNYNDIEMLTAAAIGVAVGDSREEVKAVANHVTEKSIDDGVAIVIEKFVLTQDKDGHS